MNARSRIFYLLAFAAMIALGVWFFTNFERVTTEKEVGYRGEARFNQLLAARRFLESYGDSARTVQGIDELPPRNGTLIVPTTRYEMTVRQAQNLIAWAEQGGHLVVTPVTSVDRPSLFNPNVDAPRPGHDPLLSRLGVTPVFPQGQAGPVQPVDIDWPEAGDFLQVDLQPIQRLKLSRPAALVLEDGTGVYLARFAVGKGYVTVVSNLRFLDNQAIGRYDHAAFLWHLAHLRPGPVWLVYKDTMLGLPAWLAAHAWQALVSAGVLLLIWLWYAGMRFGPVLPPPALARRRLLEHIEASGRFLWRAGQAERLLKGVRQSLYRTLELRHPAWASLPSAELYRRLAELARVSKDEVQNALLYIHAGNEHEFTKVVSTLEHLRKSL